MALVRNEPFINKVIVQMLQNVVNQPCNNEHDIHTWTHKDFIFACLTTKVARSDHPRAFKLGTPVIKHLINSYPQYFDDEFENAVGDYPAVFQRFQSQTFTGYKVSIRLMEG